MREVTSEARRAIRERVYARQIALVFTGEGDSRYDLQRALRDVLERHGYKLLSSKSSGACAICRGEGWVLKFPLAPGCIQSSVPCETCGGSGSFRDAFDREVARLAATPASGGPDAAG